MFILNSKLSSDTFFIADLEISRLLLMNDANYPWLILVPRKADLTELNDLEFAEQIEVLREINLIAKILQKNFAAEKLNIGLLGNIVKQLHIHVIGRFQNDASFPKPVWGNKIPRAYEKKAALSLIKKIKSFL
jgi:diadenosine tetraphosphate (Ap4A) HIT family hydrolase